MKAIVYIVIILVGGAGTFLTLSQTQTWKKSQEARLKTKEEIKVIDANSSVKEKEFLEAKKTLKEVSETKREEVTQRVTALESTSANLKRESDELDLALAKQEQEFVELNKALEEVNKIVEGLGGDITLDNLGDKIQEIDTAHKAKISKLEETEMLITAADKSLANNRSEADRFTKRIIERKARINRNTMEAVVTAVDQDWGFLVIGAGSNSGFTPQTGLLVMRDGHLIARVRPSSVEPTQTIAEIDFKSITTGVRIQPGDRVMLTKPSIN
jgi:myosin heavy subunit